MRAAPSTRSRSLRERQEETSSLKREELTPAVVERALRFVDWWERTYFPNDPAMFSRRLRSQGLNRRSVVPFVAAGWAAESGDAGDYPEWWARWPIEPSADSPGAWATGPVTFHVAFRPFVARAWARVLDAIEAAGTACPELSIDRDGIGESFRDHLNDRLTLVAAQALTTRLHMARMARRLGDGSPSARFETWVRNELGDPDAFRRLLLESPVLARSLVTVAEGTTAAWTELIGRLAAGWRGFGAGLGRPAGADCLVAVKAALGDTHCGGRSVMSLRFASGWSVVYKPRPMAVDAHFQDLLRWLGAHGFDPALRTVAVMDHGDHGWMEMVVHAPCETPEQIDAFYRRQGALLLVMHMLDATDIHSENLIAAGEHPVPVDLETVFQARPPESPGPPDVAGMRTRIFHDLVLRTLMLPLPMPGTAGTLDFAGLSDLNGQKTSFRVPDWVEPNTDRMRLVYRQVDLEGDKNLPRLGDRIVPATEHAEAIVAGFTDAYRVVASHREELTADGGPLDAFRHDHIRYLVRPTVEYGLLLDASYHPSCLQDAVHRDLVFDGLWRSAGAHPYRERAIASERADLWNEDVPYFSTTVDGRDLLDSRDAVIGGFLPESGLDRAVARIGRLGEDDLLRQVACIRGSLAAATPSAAVGNVAGPSPAVRPSAFEPAYEATPSELVAAATRIGDRLLELALRVEGQAHWTGVVELRGRMIWAPVGPELYGGTAGIALFLAHLAQATGRKDVEEVARAAYLDVSSHLRSPDLDRSVGAFTGASGAVYTALHLSLLWDEPAVAADAVSALGQLARRARQDDEMDLVDGAAGCILVMLRLADRFPGSSAMTIATACGGRLLRQAVRVDGGLAWVPRWTPRALVGLSHGTAGIGWALAELASATGERRFLRAAEGAMAHERSHFDAVTGNWPDLREEADEAAGARGPAVAWCHGAPGGGVARLMMRGHGLDDAGLGDEISAALRTTEASGFGLSHCLCHGDLGNAELLQLAAEAYGAPEWRSRALRRAAATLADERRTGNWRCGTVAGGETPGLMNGLAGIGYGLLRLADPGAVPSVLALGVPGEGALPCSRQSQPA